MKFYRVGNTTTQQGLWYDFEGNFTGSIHNQFDFCKCSSLPMPFDPEAVRYLSATQTLEELYEWFPLEDILRLQEHGYYLTVYEAEVYKEHQNHWLICQDSSQVIETIPLTATE